MDDWVDGIIVLILTIIACVVSLPIIAIIIDEYNKMIEKK